MFVDASAMVAILASESDAGSLTARLGQARAIYTSPIAVYETVLGIARISGMELEDAQGIVDAFLSEVDAELIPITRDVATAAIAAFERFGKGRHPAALNMGDCFAYASARQLEVPLLFKGDDFPRTDIAVA